MSLIKSVSDFVEAAEVFLQTDVSKNRRQDMLFDEPADDPYQSDLLQFYFDAIRLLRMADQADKHYRFFIYEVDRDTWFKAFCLNPSTKLGERFKQIKATVCFSATLGPKIYFERLLGLSEAANWYQVESPFKPEHLGVFTTSYLDTSYKKRNDSLYELVDSIYEISQAKAGNYLVFLPSHAYLRDVSEKFIERHGNINTIVQSPSMSEEQRTAFLASFKAQNEETAETLVGFALIGGLFGEAVDLKGSRLIGALIVGVGLPQISLERNLIRTYFDQPPTEPSSEPSNSLPARSGFEFAYQYPGMNRVLQTAGRVIRTESDVGIVCLLEQRFAMPGYRRLLPEQWQPKISQNREALIEAVSEFWSSR